MYVGGFGRPDLAVELPAVGLSSGETISVTVEDTVALEPEAGEEGKLVAVAPLPAG